MPAKPRRVCLLSRPRSALISQNTGRQLGPQPEVEYDVRGTGNDQRDAKGKAPSSLLHELEQEPDKKERGEDETQPLEEQRECQYGQEHHDDPTRVMPCLPYFRAPRKSQEDQRQG